MWWIHLFSLFQVIFFFFPFFFPYALVNIFRKRVILLDLNNKNIFADLHYYGRIFLSLYVVSVNVSLEFNTQCACEVCWMIHLNMPVMTALQLGVMAFW